MDPLNNPTPPTIPEVITGLGSNVQGVLFGLGPILFVAALIYAGYTRLTAADNPKKVQQSTQAIMWAVVGYIVVLGAFFIIRIVAAILGYDIGTGIDVDL